MDLKNLYKFVEGINKYELLAYYLIGVVELAQLLDIPEQKISQYIVAKLTRQTM